MLSDQSFHNIGVGMDKKDPDVGREEVTKDPRDRGKFKTPGLRNVALTYPYLHDGSAKTLKEVLGLYDRGGVPNPNLDSRVRPINFTGTEQDDLIAFLESLTGTLPKIATPTLPK
jgi:cytochrome c peroxidase